MRNLNRFVISLGAATLIATAPAFAGTKERIEALEASVAQLQASSPAALDANAKIDRLEGEVRALTGRVEQLTHELEQARAQLNSVSAALAGETDAGPVNLAGPAGVSDPIANQIAKADSGVTLPLDPDAAYAYASDFLVTSDYARAESAFSLFLETFPGHPRAADARFRLGEVQLAASKNTEAADTFIAFIRAYPNSARGAEAYLKLGTAFSRLNQSSEACKVFKTLKSKYPTAAPAVLQRTDVEMARINCK
ncbi:MAG: tol-pal system protein YbgF [Parvularculaceae bacterium]|nr:tol-pal system protein YbgF [Parvularculaceae bacterium]